MMKYSLILRLLLSVGILRGCDSDVKCKNEEGMDVDWYILYKLPEEIDGLKYIYLDDSTEGWTNGTKEINDASGVLANTLEPFFNYKTRMTEGFGFMLYSDQPPLDKTAPSSFGHSKGVIMLDKQTGVWLSHSTPRFPEGTERNNFWPISGNVNAQTFICVTYSYEKFKDIGLQLQYIHVYSYDHHIPNTFPMNLQCVAQRSCYPKVQPWYRVQDLVSQGGQSLKSFAKYKRFGDDLYSGLIVYHLNQTLYVKSWGKMKRPLPSNCSIPNTDHNVYDVYKVRLLNMEFLSYRVDNSKWCWAESLWLCIADMNREVSQMGRGGGAICLSTAKVQKALFTKVTCEPCRDEL
ncbi:deoxyribonuclease-2-alpha-like isoform X1 [Genypterus blacodes]|uniref:deoxyribonuclease-2-alpha-like isoform X1 n=1 Tax=Genypterus blacodes TaxID=154954 RepID=UPI003F75DB76